MEQSAIQTVWYFRLLPDCRPLRNPFKCNNGMCIPMTLKCNGVDDCGDGTDETQSCRKFHWYDTLLAVFLSALSKEFPQDRSHQISSECLAISATDHRLVGFSTFLQISEWPIQFMQKCDLGEFLCPNMCPNATLFVTRFLQVTFRNNSLQATRDFYATFRECSFINARDIRLSEKKW